MNGILFMRTNKLKEVESFYREQAGMDLWLDQGDCVILSHGNMLLGFCERDEVDNCGIITFLYESENGVDEIYQKLSDRAEHEPQKNEDYGLYHFYAKDPEGRSIEFQTFLHETPEI
jgi:hypothetical protein